MYRMETVPKEEDDYQVTSGGLKRLTRTDQTLIQI